MYAPALDACRQDMFASEDDLKKKYPDETVKKVLRIREMHNWFVSNPRAADREFVAEVMARHKISKTTAYSDLKILKALLPALSSASRDFHRWRSNEMLLETYSLAKNRKDTRTMERTIATYIRVNNADKEEEINFDFSKIKVQPFTATDDPSVLGIKPIPNIQEKIKSLLDKYRAESMDIDDVDFEEVDLELDELFPQSVIKKKSADPFEDII